MYLKRKIQPLSKLYQIVDAMAKKYQVGTDAIALRYVMDNLEPTYLLSGASNIEQNIKHNFKLEGRN
jgi:aryl-alcohol dehydrogenase-like predicted oxidoreductase